MLAGSTLKAVTESALITEIANRAWKMVKAVSCGVCYHVLPVLAFKTPTRFIPVPKRRLKSLFGISISRL